MNNRKYSGKQTGPAPAKAPSKKSSITTVASPRIPIPPATPKEAPPTPKEATQGDESPLLPPTINLTPTNEEERPMLFIELNIGKGITERVLMYENEDPEGVVDMITAKHGAFLVGFELK